MDIEVDGAFHDQTKDLATIEEIIAFREGLVGKEITIDYHHPYISIASNVKVL